MKNDLQTTCPSTGIEAILAQCRAFGAISGPSLETIQYPDGPRQLCVWKYSSGGLSGQPCHFMEPQKIPEKKPAPWPEPEPALNPLPIGDPLANGVTWPNAWPVQQPVINPSPAGEPQPLFVPTGNPVKNPNYNPNQAPSPTNQPYIQPGIRIVPTPTPGNPWQVDVQPVDKPVPSPEPNPEPTPETPEDPKPDPKEGDLCEKHPDILACQKVELKDLEPQELNSSEKTLAITPDDGWGPSSASCPAPKTAQVLGITLSMPFTMLCDFASAIKPLFIAFAWLSAALTFFGFGRKD